MNLRTTIEDAVTGIADQWDSISSMIMDAKPYVEAIYKLTNITTDTLIT